MIKDAFTSDPGGTENALISAHSLMHIRDRAEVAFRRRMFPIAHKRPRALG